jgi:HlyD family secretion protein
MAKVAAPALPPADWQATGPWIRLGNRVVCWVVGGLAVFCWLVPISGAVVAPGTVTVESNYKTVQHLDGGIVARILVRNGERVKEGQVLLRLDETATRAALAVTLGRLHEQQIQLARLEAERDRKQRITLPPMVEALRAEPQVARFIAAQQSLFDARRAAHLGEQSVLQQRLEQAGADIEGLKAQLASKQREHEIAQKELQAVLPLFEKGFANQQRLGQIQRDHARLEGEVARLRSDVARTQGVIAEAQLKLAQSEKERIQNVVDELRKVQAQLAELEETRKAQADKLDRVEIRAPRSGRVHALAAHTEGGVIQPGSAILQVIPEDERLIVEAQIPPQEIDKVRRDMHATVRFTAFNARTTPKLDGRVVTVSPAQLADSQGRQHFTAQVEIPAAELKKLGAGHELVPGMPAEVHIETASRSILSYFLKPLLDTGARTMRES